MTRIRYKHLGDNIYTSVGELRSSKTNALYVVIINKNTMEYRIKNVKRNNNVAFGGKKINNFRVLKRSIKQKLRSLGVEFDVEIRFNKKDIDK